MTQDAFADGTVRVLPSLLIERTSGGYTVILRDHATRQQIACEVLALTDVADELERVMRRAERPWTPFNSFKVKDPTKRRKLGR